MQIRDIEMSPVKKQKVNVTWEHCKKVMKEDWNVIILAEQDMRLHLIQKFLQFLQILTTPVAVRLDLFS